MPPPTDGQWLPAKNIPRPAGEPFPEISDGNRTVTDDRGIFVLHAVVLHTGKCLWFSGHTEGMHYPTLSYVFDPATETTKRVPFPPGTDFFCCHYVQMADGRILALGGSDLHFGTSPPSGGPRHGSVGAKNIVIFDPVKETWETAGEELRQGRWYPTAVTMGDGRVVVFSGRREHPPPSANAGIADEVEIINPPHWRPRKVDGTATLALPIYPGLHLVPDGRIFYTNTNWGQQIVNPPARSFLLAGTVKAPTGSWANYGGAANPSFPRREEGMSCLLPPAQDGKILVVGGSEAHGIGGNRILTTAGGNAPSFFTAVADNNDCRRAEVLSTKPVTPKWDPADGGGLTNLGRTSGHLVILPTRQVLVVGGHDLYKWRSIPQGTHPSMRPEIYTPGTGFTLLDAPMAHPRMYHSTATLLPNGRVIVTGGADANLTEPELDWDNAVGTGDPWNTNLRYSGAPRNHKTYQIYEPAYMHNGAQPQLTDVHRSGNTTHQVEYGQSIVIFTPQANDITEVSLMRPGAPTHHTDTEQRLVDLPIGARTATDVTVSIPAATDSNLLPPGYYFLWIVDNNKRPCQQAWPLQVSHPSPGPAYEEEHWCPCVFLQSVLPGLLGIAQIAYLRMLRTELETSDSRLARRWIGAVNSVYRFLSPPVARWLGRHERARLATGELVVRRLVRAVLRADRRSRRTSGLLARLTLVGMASTVLAPFVAVTVATRSLKDRRHG